MRSLLLAQNDYKKPKHKFIVVRMVLAKDYTQGMLFCGDIFICYTHEHPFQKNKKNEPGYCCVGRDRQISYNQDTSIWGNSSIKIIEDPDNLGDWDIAVGLIATPHGGIGNPNGAMTRLRAISAKYKQATLSFYELENVPPDWMCSWLAKAW